MNPNEKPTTSTDQLSKQALAIKRAVAKQGKANERVIPDTVSETAQQIEEQGEMAVVNTYQWMVENKITVPPAESMAITDPERYKREMEKYLQRSTDEILNSGYAIACADNAQVMADILRAKGEQTKCVDTLSETFIRTGDKQGHMFIEISTANGSKVFNPSNGQWNTWQVDENGNKFIHWHQSIDMGNGPEKIDEKYYYFLEGESPQAIGYTDIGSMQDLAESGRNSKRFDQIRAK